MSLPDNASLETLSLAELRELVGTLVAKVADLGTANAALTAENQALRDEAARLKGLPPRPPSRPSGMEKATGDGTRRASAASAHGADAAPSATGTPSPPRWWWCRPRRPRGHASRASSR